MTGDFGEFYGDRPGRGIDPLGLVAVGVTLTMVQEWAKQHQDELKED
jgi:hypothetical protein